MIYLLPAMWIGGNEVGRWDGILMCWHLLHSKVGSSMILLVQPSIPANSRDEDHEQHVCDDRLCPIPCQLCKRLCANQDHLHGLQMGAIHLCGFVSIYIFYILYVDNVLSTDKSIPVPHSAQSLVFVRLIQPHSQLRPPSRAGTKHSIIPK
jgi:hypothetical protein